MCHQLINADGLPRIILISNIHDQMVNTCKISCLDLKRLKILIITYAYKTDQYNGGEYRSRVATRLITDKQAAASPVNEEIIETKSNET